MPKTYGSGCINRGCGSSCFAVPSSQVEAVCPAPDQGTNTVLYGLRLGHVLGVYTSWKKKKEEDQAVRDLNTNRLCGYV